MSGGSLDYICYKVEDIANQLSDKSYSPLQRAFGEHLKKVSQALHDTEWVLSGDKGRGDDEEAIRAVLGDSADAQALSVLKADAIILIEQLNKFTNP